MKFFEEEAKKRRNLAVKIATLFKVEKVSVATGLDALVAVLVSVTRSEEISDDEAIGIVTEAYGKVRRDF